MSGPAVPLLGAESSLSGFDGAGELVSRHARDGRFLYASASLHERFGFEWEELLGRTLWDLVHPFDAPALGKDGLLHVSTAPGPVALRMRHRRGHWQWVDAVPSVLRDDGSTVRLRITVLADGPAADLHVQQESRLEALGRLAAGLAHEINSPIQFVGDNARFLAAAFEDLMRVVQLYRGMLDSPQPIAWAECRAGMRTAEEAVELDYLQAEVPSAIEQTLAGIERVTTIVRAMKTFSHPGEEEHVPSDLNGALEATLTVARHQVDSVAELSVHLGDLPPVWCRLAELNQVFLNLLVNAADAIADTGVPGRIDVTTERDGESVVISVQDTGAGIPEDVLPRIFDPFFTTKEVGRGTGQGLALAWAVVHDRHGGSLTVVSEPGRGSTFTIRLPVDGRGRAPAIAG